MYVQSKNHLQNIITKALKENKYTPDKDKLLPMEFIIEQLFKSSTKNGNPILNIVDQFSWDIKQDPSLVEEDKFWNWFSKKSTIDSFTTPNDIEHILTAEFLDRLKTLIKVSGVYLFFNKKNHPLYIGMSINIQERSLTSFRERFSKYNKPVYFTACVTQNAADAAIIEAYFINQYKPTLNGATKYDEKPTLNVKPIPDLEEKILCNRVNG